MSLKIFEFDSYPEQGPRGVQYTHSSTKYLLFILYNSWVMYAMANCIAMEMPKLDRLGCYHLS